MTAIRISLIPSNQLDQPQATGISEGESMKRITEEVAWHLKQAGCEVEIFLEFDVDAPLEALKRMCADSNKYKPDVVLFLHSDSTGQNKPAGVMVVQDYQDEYRKRDWPWAMDFGKRLGDLLGWGNKGVWFDSKEGGSGLINYLFFTRTDQGPKRLLLEMMNDDSLEQAVYMRDHPEDVGFKIASALLASLNIEEDDLADSKVIELLEEIRNLTKSIRYEALASNSFRDAIGNALRNGDTEEATRLNTEMEKAGFTNSGFVPPR